VEAIDRGAIGARRSGIEPPIGCESLVARADLDTEATIG